MSDFTPIQRIPTVIWEREDYQLIRNADGKGELRGPDWQLIATAETPQALKTQWYRLVLAAEKLKRER